MTEDLRLATEAAERGDLTALVTAGGPLSAIAKGSPTPGTPILIAIHGGGFNCRYFDVPGRSLLELAAAAGFRTVSIDRPGYRDSAVPPPALASFAGQAQILEQAIEQLWRDCGNATPGIVLISHSIGAAIAVHIAARSRRWPLLGIAIHGIGTAPGARGATIRGGGEEDPSGASAGMTLTQGSGDTHPAVDMPLQARRALLYGPEDTYDADALEAVAPSCAPVPVYELLEVGGAWTADAPRLARLVDVPVHYRLAAHDTLWQTGANRVTEFAQLFTAAPFTDARLMEATGHNIDHHHAGLELHLEQLAFAARCAGRSRSASPRLGAE